MRRIKRGNIKFISLVPKGANRLSTIFKDEDADGNNFEVSMLSKTLGNFEERGEILACVYAPEFRDSQGDIASAEVIRDMMHEFMRNGANIDIRHNEKPVTKQQAFVAQNFEIQKDDPRFVDQQDYDGKPVDVTGGWGVLIKIEDPALRKQYSAGEWKGVSMGGHAVTVGESLLDPSVLKALTKALAGGNAEDTDMTKDELAAVLKENREATATAIESAVSKAMKPTEPSGIPGEVPTKKSDKKRVLPPNLIYKGDYTPEDVQRHQFKVRKHFLMADAIDLDYSDADAVQKHNSAMSDLVTAEKAFNEEHPLVDADADLRKELGIDAADASEVAVLKIRLAKAEKKSNQQGPSKDGIRKQDTGGSGDASDDNAKWFGLAKTITKEQGISKSADTEVAATK